MIAVDNLNVLSQAQLRQTVELLLTELRHKTALVDKLTHEMAVLKRLKFAATSEKFCAGLKAEQKSLLEETLETDLAQLASEIEQLQLERPATSDKTKAQPKREALPANLPRVEVQHEPDSTVCGCGCQMKRIGQEVSEKLDYEPGVFTVQRHVRGKWACAKCQKLVQAPVQAHVIDKGIPTAGLLAHVLVAKFMDHLPLYRQERIFERAGMLIARSTLAQWVGECGARLQPLVDALSAELRRQAVLHADETPVAMLKPGNGKTHKAYLWTYCSSSFSATQAVVFDFADSRSGEHVRQFLGLPGEGGWKGKLVTDDFSGYKACFELGVTEVGCMAHARRKFHEMWANHQSPVAEQALRCFGWLYDFEREVRQGDAAHSSQRLAACARAPLGRAPPDPQTAAKAQ